MKKLTAFLMAVMLLGSTAPCHAATKNAVPIGGTPKFSIPKLPTIPTIKPKFTFNIDLGDYIPRIY